MTSDLPRDASWKAIQHRLVPLMRPDNRTNIGDFARAYLLLGLILCWLSVVTVVHAGGPWPLVFLFWALPALTIFPTLMQLREVAHHGNAPGEDRITGSRIFRVQPLWSAFVFPDGRDDHLFAMLPHDRMKAANRSLREDPRLRERVVIRRGFCFRTPGTEGPSVLDVLAREPRPGDLVGDGPPPRRSTPDGAEGPVALAQHC